MKKNITVLLVISVVLMIAGIASAIEPVKCVLAPQGSGLTWDGNYLWLASNNDNRIYKLDPDNGDILDDIPSPEFSPRDLAFDGQYLWNVDPDVVFGGIFQIDPATGIVIRSIPMPPSAVSPSGLTWDGEALWLSAVAAGILPMIYKIDPSDGSVIGSFTAPAGEFGFSGLAWDGDYLWFSSSTFSPTGFFKIDPSSGEVLDFIEYVYTGEGLTFDNLYLWNNSIVESKTCQFGISPLLIGDVDNDGNINILDALYTARFSAGLSVPPDFDETAADTNCDTFANILDALLIARYAAGLSMDGTEWCGG